MLSDDRGERREHRRVEFSAPVEVFHGGAGIGSYGSMDISERGIQLSSLPVRVGGELKVLVAVSDAGKRVGLLLDGVVVWRRADRAGVRFFEPGTTNARTLERVVASAQA